MMWRQIVVTGATGALGIPLLRALLRNECSQRIGLLIRSARSDAKERFSAMAHHLEQMGVSTHPLFYVDGDLLEDCRWRLDEQLSYKTEVVLHAAAITQFRAPDLLHERVNVQGTRRVVDWARRCPNLSHVVLASTTCVAGARTGVIAEVSTPEPPEFINAYERTKWQAERLAIAAGVPTHIVRLSTCVGDREDGRVWRAGALHHALRWFYHGLIPMIPGSCGSHVDFLPTDTATEYLARAVERPPSGVEIHQVASGDRAAGLHELVEFLVALFGETHAGWRRGQISTPTIADAATFASFRRSVTQSRDALFGQVMESMEAFLPGLLYPKTYETSHAERFWGGWLSVPDWRQTLRRVVQFCLQNDWGRSPRGEDDHAAWPRD
jgi:nucleoside-diphosphate-sugar epimerase